LVSKPCASSARWRELPAENATRPDQDHVASQLFCVLDLPAEIDLSRCIAILRQRSARHSHAQAQKFCALKLPTAMKIYA
jgi:hypothetical protein